MRWLHAIAPVAPANTARLDQSIALDLIASTLNIRSAWSTIVNRNLKERPE